MGFPFPLPRPESRLCLVASAGENGRLRVNMGYLVSIWVEKISVIAAAVCFFFVFVLLRWFHLVCFVLIFVEIFFWIKTRLVFQHARWTCLLGLSLPRSSGFLLSASIAAGTFVAWHGGWRWGWGQRRPGKCGNGDRWHGVVALRRTTLRVVEEFHKRRFIWIVTWLDGSTRARALMYEETCNILYASIGILWYDSIYYAHTYIYIYITYTVHKRRASRRSLVVWVVVLEVLGTPKVYCIGRYSYIVLGVGNSNTQQQTDTYHRFEY